jgi:hypothetical protein
MVAGEIAEAAEEAPDEDDGEHASRPRLKLR